MIDSFKKGISLLTKGIPYTLLRHQPSASAKLVFPKMMLYLEIIMKFICMWYIVN